MTGAEPVWLRIEAIIALHDRSLALHGGPSGIRDRGLLESALDRPKNRFLYERESDVATLAATYAVGLASNHPFVDGNKRAAFEAMLLFLGLNGRRLSAEKVDSVTTMLRVAAGEIGVDQLTLWIRKNTTAR